MKAKSLWTAGGVTVILLILASTILFGIMPTYSMIQNVDTQIKAIRSENSFRLHYLSVLRNRAKNKDHFYISVNRQRLEIPSNMQVVEFLNELDLEANAAHVKLSGVQLNLPQTFPVPASITHSAAYAAASTRVAASNHLKSSAISITAIGGLGGIRSFLSALEHGPRYVRVASVRLSSVDASNASKGQLKAEIAGQIFTYEGAH